VTIDVSLTEGRYDRQSLITWWDQDLLQSARVLLVGAGALGNEIGKNLALVGFGHVTIVDMDTIEHTNLARCAMFRDGDEGKMKAEVLAARLKEINPDIDTSFVNNRVETLGEAVIDEFDLIIAGLDSRIARAWVNQACRHFGKAWVDGAIEGIRGVARVFGPDGACYECTLGEVDRKIMAQRKSCALLATEEILAGKVPTNATTASIIAGVQVQELIKLRHALDDIPVQFGRGLMFIGETLDTYIVTYDEDESCVAHSRLPDRVDAGYADSRSIRDLINLYAPSCDSVMVLHDVVRASSCPHCGTPKVRQNKMLDSFGTGALICEKCETPMSLEVVTSWTVDDDLCEEPLSKLGLSEFDVIGLRAGRGLLPLVVRSEGK